MVHKSDKLVFRIYAKHRTSDQEEVSPRFPLVLVGELFEAEDLSASRHYLVLVLSSLIRLLDCTLTLENGTGNSSLTFSFDRTAPLDDTGVLRPLREEIDSEAFQRRKVEGIKNVFLQVLSLGTAASEVRAIYVPSIIAAQF